MSKHAENYASLIAKVDGFIRKYYLNKVLKGSIIIAAGLLAAYLVLSVAEYYGYLAPMIKTGLVFSFLAGSIIVITHYIAMPLFAYFRLGKVISYEQASEIIGNHFQPVKDKLINTLQLKRLADTDPTQRLLIEASIDQKISELSPIPFTSAIRLEENRKYLKYALPPFAVIVIVFFAAPSILTESTARLIDYDKRFARKAPFQFVVLNKNLSAVEGTDFTLEVKLNGQEIPAELYLEDGANSFKLSKESTVKFNYTFKNLQKDKVIRLKGGGFSSKDLVLRVKEKPSLLNFQVKLQYPAYLNKNSEVLDNTGDLTVPQGTQISWTFSTKSSDKLNLGIGRHRLSVNALERGVFNFSHRAMVNTDYYVKPVNQQVSTSDSVAYQIRVVPDLNPAIEVSERVDSANSKLIYFVGQVNDDHGFSKLNFHYRIVHAVNEAKKISKDVVRAIPFEKSALQSNFFHAWNVGETDVKPGDQIEYFFEVFDNDGVNGAKSARSAMRTFKVASEAEVDKKIEANTEKIKQKMEQAIRQSSQLEKDAKKLNQELLSKKAISYEERKQIEAILQKQKDLENLVKEIQQENKQNLFDQRENKDQTEQILEKQKQIEELFNNVLDEKTREILKNIEKLLEKSSRSLTQEELSKMQMDNKSLQKELDRILELYKQLEFDQKLAETIDKLDKLSQKQDELANRSESKENAKELTEAQRALNQEFQEIKQDLSSVEQKNEDLEQPSNFDNPVQDQEKIDQEQSRSSDNLERKDQRKAAEHQKSAAKQMQQLSRKLQEMQQQGDEQENQVNMRALREILDNLVTSSFDQERIMQTIRSMSASDPAYVQQTQKQREIKDNLKMIEDSLYTLSKKIPQIQSVVNKEIQTINFNVGKAIESLAERRSAEANRSQQFAMTSLNNLALMLNEALEQMQNAQQNGKPGSKGQRKSLSQLTQMQQALNRNMEQARQQMQQQGQQPGQRPGQQGRGMSEQLARMAREQQMIRQAMQEINRLENKDGRNGLGNLNELMKEMEQTETDLVNKKIQQETIMRQQEILTKLLEAEKAERERDQNEQRESKEGINPSPNYKAILQEFQKVKQKETDLLRTVPPTLNSFYKIKVGDYFKYLNSGFK